MTIADATLELNASEARAAKAFEETIDGGGISDCFDTMDLAHIRLHTEEFGVEQTRRMLQQHAEMLNTWYLAVDTLLGDLLACTAEYTRYSPAASLYAQIAAGRYHRTRQGFEYAVTTWALGLLTHPVDGNYPPNTKNLCLPTQSLTSD